jgi:predicted MFS family arabinose efflux permease
VLRLFRNRDFVLLISGQAVSQVGDGIFMVALAWRVFQSYNSPAALSIVGIAFMLPRVVVTLAGGVLSDRFERRWTMIFADLGRAIPIALLAAISLAPAQELVLIVILVAVQAVAGSLFHPAEAALLPQLVEPEDLAAANSVRTIIGPLAWNVVGSALGGALTAVYGTSTAFWLNAGTFGVSILTLLFMRPRPMTPTATRTSVLADAREGFAYVAGRPWLWGPILAASLGQLVCAGPTQALIPYLVKNELHASAAALGLVFAAGGVGTITAGLIMSRISRPPHIVTWMVLGWAAGFSALAVVGLAQTVWQAALAMFVWSVLLWSGEILWLTLLGLTVPNQIRGRVSSIDFVGSFWLIPASMALTGPASALLGPRTVLMAAGVVGGLAMLLTLLVPGVTRPQFLSAARTPAADLPLR